MRKVLLFLAVICLPVTLLAMQGIGGKAAIGGKAGVGGGASGGGGGGCSTITDSQTGATGTDISSVGQFSGDKWYATNFTAGSTYTACQVILRMKNVGTPTGNLTAYIYTDSAGAPGTLVGTGSGTVAVSGIGTTEQDVAFTGMSASLTSSTAYWVVVMISTASQNPNYVSWATANQTGPVVDHSADGTTWTGVGTNRQGKFTIYK